MLKKINNWQLSFLIVIVSIFSVSLAQKYVLAAWQEPVATPGNIANKNIVLNPMTTELTMGDYNIVGTNIIIATTTNALTIRNNANLCFGTVCKSAWPDDPDDAVWNPNTNGIDYVAGNIGIGIALPTQLLHIDNGNLLITNGNLSLGSLATIKATNNAGTEDSVLYLDGNDTLNVQGDDVNFKDLSGNNLVYIDDIGTRAKLGIGTITPNKSLHILTPTGINAEIDIQSGVADHWGIYQDETSGDLRFWNNNNNNVVFNSAGYVGIGTDTPSNQLHVEAVNQTAIYGITDTLDKYGVYAENTAAGGTALYGLGHYGVVAISNNAGGAGLFAYQNLGDYSGQFFGNVQVATGDLTVATGDINITSGTLKVVDGYIQFPVVSTNPISSECASILDRGKAVFNSTTGALVICNYVQDLPDPYPWKDYNYAIATE